MKLHLVLTTASLTGFSLGYHLDVSKFIASAKLVARGFPGGDYYGKSSGDGPQRPDLGGNQHLPGGNPLTNQEQVEQDEQAASQHPYYGFYAPDRPELTQPAVGEGGRQVVDDGTILFLDDRDNGWTAQDVRDYIEGHSSNGVAVRYTTPQQDYAEGIREADAVISELNSLLWDIRREEASEVLRRIGHRVGAPLRWYRTLQSHSTPAQAARLHQDSQTDPEIGGSSFTYQDNSAPGSQAPGPHLGGWNPTPLQEPEHAPGDYLLDPQLRPVRDDYQDNAEYERALREWRGVFGESSFQRPSKYKRRDPTTTFIGQINKAASDNSTKSIVDQTAQFQQYLAKYQSIQASVSDAILPILDIILNKTSNQIIYELCWSVYSDLTRLGPKIIGPFSYGRHNFNWLEDQYLGNKTNVTSMVIDNTTDPATLSFLATNQVLINIYNFAWSNATTAANQSGQLSTMNILERYLLPIDTSIESQVWTSQQSFDKYRYFTAWNKTAHDSI